MRHRKRGRRLGRSSSHRRAMLRNLASSLILTERDAEFDPNPPKEPGRVVTTLQKAKEVRPLIEKCVTIARKSLPHERAAEEYATSADRRSEDYKQWRKSDQWQKWAAARAPVVAARRRVLQLLGDKQAVRVLFEEIAPRFEDRPGGYTRVIRLARPRLGDAGTRAMLEFVGKNDRVPTAATKPAFDSDIPEETDEPSADTAPPPDDASPDDASPDDAPPEDASPEDASPEDAPPEDASPEDAPPEDASPEDSAADSDQPTSDPAGDQDSSEKADG